MKAEFEKKKIPLEIKIIPQDDIGGKTSDKDFKMGSGAILDLAPGEDVEFANPHETFTIELNGREYPNCKIKSAWNGLTQFVLPSTGTIIVHGYEKSEFEQMFPFFADTVDHKKLTVMMISPSLLDEAMEQDD